MTAAEAVLGRLAAREPIDDAVALVVAHPDDEVIAAGAVLPLFRRLLLVHVTDGAPRNLADANAHGFADADSYAAARRAELGRALAYAVPPLSFTGEVAAQPTEAAWTERVPPPPCFAWSHSPTSQGRISRCELGASDQGASDRMAELAIKLRGLLTEHSVRLVLTHPYEGGHPDHDATAFIAHHARLPMMEFASYHAAQDGGMQTGCFLPGPEPLVLGLTPDEQARKRAMLAAFTTQAATLAPFGTERECFRPAPRYDFTQSPHPGQLHYEKYDWGMTGERWRALAAEAHRALC